MTKIAKSVKFLDYSTRADVSQCYPAWPIFAIASEKVDPLHYGQSDYIPRRMKLLTSTLYLYTDRKFLSCGIFSFSTRRRHKPIETIADLSSLHLDAAHMVGTKSAESRHDYPPLSSPICPSSSSRKISARPVFSPTPWKPRPCQRACRGGTRRGGPIITAETRTDAKGP